MTAATWEVALEKWLVPWRKRAEVTGALVCGSYVTGNPSPRSDIDVHVVLKPSTKWRERGNDVVDGFLIEYFANPAKVIRGYFKQNHAANDHMDATMFVTGRIVFDHAGAVAKLKREAEAWLKKPFRKPSRVDTASGEYRLWDALDDFQDAVEQGEPDLVWRYVHSLDALRRIYAHHTGDCIARVSKVHAHMSSDLLQRKYRQRAFSDAIFARRFAAAMLETDQAKMLATLESLTRYVHRKMGGFEIDGFRLRSPAMKG